LLTTKEKASWTSCIATFKVVSPYFCHHWKRFIVENIIARRDRTSGRRSCFIQSLLLFRDFWKRSFNKGVHR